ncbi:hypothetical protein shim_05690 [Shimia sp. SK013]|uniref:effector-associated constant component EACC1 n=1 Tax=Shimia sp. SK013 TaxID=1389006 RepID=UPI0006B59B4D|nr:hypothetical protein shim_05690 [Shimia sp. SK013]
MQLEVGIEGNSTAEQDVADAQDLLSWLKASRLKNVDDLALKEVPPEEGELGPTVLAVIGAILGAEATVELVKQVFSWLEAKNKKIVINVAQGDKEISIDATNLTTEELDRVTTTLGLASG